MLDDLLDHALHNVIVRLQQIVAAHPWLARKSSGDHHHVAVRRRGIISIRRADSQRVRIGSRNRPGLQHVQTFARRRPIQNIRQHHVRQLLVDKPLRRGRSYKTAPHHRHFFPTHRVYWSFRNRIVWNRMRQRKFKEVNDEGERESPSANSRASDWQLLIFSLLYFLGFLTLLFIAALPRLPACSQ